MDAPAQAASERITKLITTLLRIALALAAVYGIVRGNWPVVFSSLGTFALTYVPQVIASQANFRLPLQFELGTTVFLYATIFLGEAGDYYERFWWWDTLLHTGSAFAFGFAGFLILYLLFVRNKLQASPFLVAVFSFAFGLSIGALWEIFEYAMDNLFGLNMQKTGLRDTMGDLIVDAIGAGTASIIGYISLKYDVRDPFDPLISWFIKANPGLVGKPDQASAAQRSKPRRRS